MRTGGIFYFPWHRHQIEGTNGFYCLIRKTLASGVNGIAKVPKIKVFTEVELEPSNVRSPVDALTHSATAPPRRARDNDITGYRSSGKIRLASRRCTTVPIAPLGGVKSTNSCFLRFFVRSVPLFKASAHLEIYPLYNTLRHLILTFRFCYSLPTNLTVCH